jgi:DNA invertase Pin-like site-specific DNA recombinase
MAEGKFVAYYRVSTAEQGRSGLGLEAQREAVQRYLNGGGWELLGEFTEVETGKGSNALAKRPALNDALALAKRHKATLIIAKMDRLSRNVHFITGLLEAGVNFTAVDNPSANKLTVHILAAVAEAERDAISERTKAALAAAKVRAGSNWAAKSNGRVLAVKHKAEALDRLQPLAADLLALKGQGLTVRAIATELNSRGVMSPAGKPWMPGNVHRALQRLTPDCQ